MSTDYQSVAEMTRNGTTKKHKKVRFEIGSHKRQILDVLIIVSQGRKCFTTLGGFCFRCELAIEALCFTPEVNVHMCLQYDMVSHGGFGEPGTATATVRESGCFCN